MTFTIKRPEWVSDELVAERGEYAGFQMYTREGNDECAIMVLAFVEAIEARPPVPSDIPKLLSAAVELLAQRHGEVYDTEPRGEILRVVNIYLTSKGYRALEEMPL